MLESMYDKISLCISHVVEMSLGAGVKCDLVKLSGLNNSEGNVLVWDTNKNLYLPICDDGWDK